MIECTPISAAAPPRVVPDAARVAGAVPRLLAPILTAMGAEPVYWSHRPKPEAPARWPELAELLATSDIVSLHLPLTSETAELVDIRAVREGAILVDTARGRLVDEAVLLAALKSGRIAAAGLDVAVENVRHLVAGEPLRFCCV